MKPTESIPCLALSNRSLDRIAKVGLGPGAEAASDGAEVREGSSASGNMLSLNRPRLFRNGVGRFAALCVGRKLIPYHLLSAGLASARGGVPVLRRHSLGRQGCAASGRSLRPGATGKFNPKLPFIVGEKSAARGPNEVIPGGAGSLSLAIRPCADRRAYRRGLPDGATVHDGGQTYRRRPVPY